MGGAVSEVFITPQQFQPSKVRGRETPQACVSSWSSTRYTKLL